MFCSFVKIFVYGWTIFPLLKPKEQLYFCLLWKLEIVECFRKGRFFQCLLSSKYNYWFRSEFFLNLSRIG
ncbi:uncharacterized protein Gasu_54360 [Galdieria sulphuraria]|uniref:Uncharacterized protein n=1 Tax=Galdieria sulphuraria TaxID=130081 RepID=M2WSX3_GALSU|nr:uncharacterized protein Gasu_54360 [Galdieria sulphuraria]EME26985.1 hypothetical protein Gasu_54360 [Galdieria sulphuraria]|eukprot:XP_005703505.1 hypothetical protein Gasu_54360 [Galdieria sulphuraria]